MEGEQGKVKHDGTRVEREDVCPFHQGETSCTEFLTQGRGDFFLITCIELLLELLEAGGHFFL